MSHAKNIALWAFLCLCFAISARAQTQTTTLLSGQVVQIVTADGLSMPTLESSCSAYSLIYEAISSGQGYLAGQMAQCINGVIVGIGTPSASPTNPNGTACTVNVSPLLSYGGSLYICGTSNSYGQIAGGGGSGNATTVNGAAIPFSQSCVGTNGSGQFVTGACSGSGVTSFPSTLFNVTGNTAAYSTGQTANEVLGTNSSGAVGFLSLTSAMLPLATSSVTGASRPDNSTITVLGGILSSVNTVSTVLNPIVPSWLMASTANGSTTPQTTFSAASGQTSHRTLGTCGTATSISLCTWTLSDEPQIPTNTVYGNVSGTTSYPSALTSTNLSALLGLGSAAFTAISAYDASGEASAAQAASLQKPATGTGLIAGTSVTNATTIVTLPLSIANGGTGGSTTPTISAGTGISVSGAFPTWSIAATGSSSPLFSALSSGTNTTAAMLVGTGASLAPTGSGTISANLISGSAPAPSATVDATNASNISSGTINAARIPTLNQNTTGTALGFTGNLAGDVTGMQSTTTVGKINGVSLAGLSTGILKNTTTTGVPSIAVASDFPVLNQSTSGNAATATSLAATPTQAPSGQYCTGVTATGNCNAATVSYSQLSGTPTLPGSTIVGVSDTQTLTNKSIAGSEINSGTIAANYLAVTNLATTGNGGVTGNLPVTNLNSGTNASSTTFWRGDGTWATTGTGGGGNVSTSANLVSGNLVVATGTTTIANSGFAPPTSTIVGISDSQTLTNKTISYSEITGLAASATTDTTNASNITSGTLASSRIPTLNQSTTGNAATATALAGTPFVCSTGQAPTGILASGNATGCTAIVSSVALSLPSAFTVSGSPITSSGTLTAVWASQMANLFFAGPNGSSGTPSFRAIVAADIPTLNQNTTGSAASFSGSLAGDVTGTQSATTVGKLNGVSLAGLATGILKNTTTTGVPSIAVASDFPTLNQSTTGNAATATALAANPTTCSTGQAPTGILASGNATGCAAIGGGSALPWTTNGDTVYYTGTTAARLAGPTAAQLFVLSETGTGSAPAAPIWTAQYSLSSGLGTSVTGTASLAVNVSLGVRNVIGTTDTILSTDCGSLVTYNNSSAVTVALPQAGIGGNFLSGCPITLTNYGAGAVTVTASTSLIGPSVSSRIIPASSGSGSSLTVHSCTMVSDGSNFQMADCQ